MSDAAVSFQLRLKWSTKDGSKEIQKDTNTFLKPLCSCLSPAVMVETVWRTPYNGSSFPHHVVNGMWLVLNDAAALGHPTLMCSAHSVSCCMATAHHSGNVSCVRKATKIRQKNTTCDWTSRHLCCRRSKQGWAKKLDVVLPPMYREMHTKQVCIVFESIGGFQTFLYLSPTLHLHVLTACFEDDTIFFPVLCYHQSQ